MYSDQRTFSGVGGTIGVNVFLAAPDCAWTLRMVQAGNGDPEKYKALFGRMVSSFAPNAPLP